MLEETSAWFWKEEIWLPPNATWGDVTNERASDLYYGFGVAFFFIVAKFTVERYVFSRIVRHFSMEPKISKTANVVTFRTAQDDIHTNITHNDKQVQKLSRKIQQSSRLKTNGELAKFANKRPPVHRFNEIMWKLLIRIFAVFYGLYVLWDKPWTWNTLHCCTSYPNHKVTNDISWYYILQTGFYCSLTFAQILDLKRKDFMQMMMHHLVTLSLISLSWRFKLFRYGSLCFIVHDIGDFGLGGVTLSQFIKNQRVANACFAFCIIPWLISRIILFPIILNSVLNEAVIINPTSPFYLTFIVLLSTLQCLHLMWTWRIFKLGSRSIMWYKLEVPDQLAFAPENRKGKENNVDESSENC